MTKVGQITSLDDAEILEQAARWVVRARSGLSTDERRAFHAWLTERSEHAAAAEAAACAWESTPAAARRAGITVSLRDSASLRGSWSWGGWEAATAALVLPLMMAASWWMTNCETRQYSSGAHQRVVATLPDGSKAWLAPRSRLIVRLDPFRRRLELPEGEVMLQVAHQPRSFFVDVGGYRIVDRGTLFDVRRRGGEPVSVALVNGQIDIHDRDSGKLVAHPKPGERIKLGVDGKARTLSDAQAATAWREGRVVLENCPLSEALARFAEQGAPTVRLRDVAAGRMRVSGVFAVENIDSFLSSVAELHPVTWRRSAQGYEVASQ